MELVSSDRRLYKLINQSIFKHCTTYNKSLNAVALENKIIDLYPFDDKRVILGRLEDKVHTLPHGHYSIEEELEVELDRFFVNAPIIS
ncbi:Uncharacterized protein FWK35_00005150, partial [Aphis craccivora]